MSHIDRVVIEKNELDEKLGKLYNFLYNDIAITDLSKEDVALLNLQYDTMSAYSKILGIRIANGRK